MGSPKVKARFRPNCAPKLPRTRRCVRPELKKEFVDKVNEALGTNKQVHRSISLCEFFEHMKRFTKTKRFDSAQHNLLKRHYNERNLKFTKLTESASRAIGVSSELARAIGIPTKMFVSNWVRKTGVHPKHIRAIHAQSSQPRAASAFVEDPRGSGKARLYGRTVSKDHRRAQAVHTMRVVHEVRRALKGANLRNETRAAQLKAVHKMYGSAPTKAMRAALHAAGAPSDNA
jgi:hypothetical protein